MMQFKDSNLSGICDLLLDDVERFEALAFQAENGWWNMARTQHESGRIITLACTDIADGLCAGAESLAVEIMKKLATVCQVTYTPITLSAKKTLYVGPPEEDAGNPSSIGGIPVVVVNMGVPSVGEEEAQFILSATGSGLINGLRAKVKWIKQWLANYKYADLSDAYRATLADVYTWTAGVFGNVGSNFPTVLTDYHCQTTNTFDRPRLSVQFSAANSMKISVIPDYEDGRYACPQIAPNGFHKIKIGDILHVVRLGIPEYEDFDDKVYSVIGVDAYSMTLRAWFDGDYEEEYPEVISEPANYFSEHFLIRKLEEL